MRWYWQVIIIFLIIVIFLGSVQNARYYKIPDWLVKRWQFHAITLPPFGIFLASTANNNDTIRHELVHWEQWKRLGTFGFYYAYLLGWLKYGYRNNPMEIEAYEA